MDLKIYQNKLAVSQAIMLDAARAGKSPTQEQVVAMTDEIAGYTKAMLRVTYLTHWVFLVGMMIGGAFLLPMPFLQALGVVVALKVVTGVGFTPSFFMGAARRACNSKMEAMTKAMHANCGPVPVIQSPATMAN